jgi:hypothetical protein
MVMSRVRIVTKVLLFIPTVAIVVYFLQTAAFLSNNGYSVDPAGGHPMGFALTTGASYFATWKSRRPTWQIVLIYVGSVLFLGSALQLGAFLGATYVFPGVAMQFDWGWGWWAFVFAPVAVSFVAYWGLLSPESLETRD